ncbi:MAG: DNA adenine methylase [Planctomycetes bacterium]|nr:DNA adenine methylase [Planctomycetota bacterium]
MTRRTPSPVTCLARPKVLAFGWYGGKFSHLEWLLPLLPKTARYCEPFGGSGAVLLNREPSDVETYNDLDGEVCNFFRVLRDESDALVKAIALTPFSREEFVAACTLDSRLPPSERARRFYVRARQVRTGLAQSATPGRWANCKDTSRNGMSGVVSRWINGADDLCEIAERLLRVQIENRPAIEAIELYDSPETLFYCDPPYVHETRGDASAYAFEMTDDEHAALARALAKAEGSVAVSGYDCELMNALYPPPRWKKTTGPGRTVHSVKQTRWEVLWTNYDPAEARLGLSRKRGRLTERR